LTTAVNWTGTPHSRPLHLQQTNPYLVKTKQLKKFLKKPRKEGITDNEWILKRNMKIGAWNVRRLFWPGALKVLHNQLSKLDFDVVALQETQLESGIQKSDNFAIFNSGLENKKHEFGCDFL
jgi:hypothetical protein